MALRIRSAFLYFCSPFYCLLFRPHNAFTWVYNNIQQHVYLNTFMYEVMFLNSPNMQSKPPLWNGSKSHTRIWNSLCTKSSLVGLRCLAPFHGQIIHKKSTSESNAKVNSLTFQPFVESQNFFCEKGKTNNSYGRSSNDGTRKKNSKRTRTQNGLYGRPPKELIQMKQNQCKVTTNKFRLHRDRATDTNAFKRLVCNLLHCSHSVFFSCRCRVFT